MIRYLLIIFSIFFSHFIQAEPLAAEEVFIPSVKLVDPNSFRLSWHIKDGYFLYQDRIKLSQPADSVFQLGTIRLPPAIEKKDRQGHCYMVYRHRVDIPVAILGVDPGESLLEVHYQGCADDGFCYPPETRQIKLTIDKQLSLAFVQLEPKIDVIQPAKEKEPQTNDIAHLYASSNWFIVIFSFFCFGLLLSFTPCVLPMIPVLSGIIVGHGHDISTRKAFLLSLSYVLSMSITYAVVGAVVAGLGSNLQVVMQTSWVIALFSLLFILLALSMFGLYELKLPLSWQAKLAKISKNQNSGHYLGAALMGCLSTLILSPCVTAPLIGALSYIAHTGNMLFGVITLFFLGLGMGTPLLLIGTSAGRYVPKAGLWMNTVKNFFGILLLGVAIYLLSRLLPAVFIMMLWASLLVFTGIFSGALTKAQTHQEKFHQAVGLLLLVYGLFVLAGASMGSQNPLQPLAGVFSPATAAHLPSHNVTVKTVDELDSALKQNNGKPIMLDFYADWCASCKLIEATTLKDPQVKKALKHFAVIRVDLTANDNETELLMEKYQVIAPPSFLFLTPSGKERSTQRLVGDISTATFLKHLQAMKLDSNNN